MPIYEYLCERCGRIAEVMQKVNDRPPSSCPECGSRRLAKLVSRTAFQLKGGGWYADLYGSSKKKEAGKEPAKEGSKAPPKEAAPAPAPAGEKRAPAKARPAKGPVKGS